MGTSIGLICATATALSLYSEEHRENPAVINTDYPTSFPTQSPSIFAHTSTPTLKNRITPSPTPFNKKLAILLNNQTFSQDIVINETEKEVNLTETQQQKIAKLPRVQRPNNRTTHNGTHYDKKKFSNATHNKKGHR